MIDNKNNTPSDAAIWWQVRLTADEEMSEAEHREFWRWLTADPQHEKAFLAQANLWDAFGDLDPEFRTRQIAWLTEFNRRELLKRRWVVRLSIAASLLVLLVGAGFYLRTHDFASASSATQTYATHTGETRTVQLADGSTARLNTRTHLQWIADRQHRRVVLLDGEALFNVAPDATRPFRVEVDGSEIQALGTQFNVYRKSSGDIAVTVFEGAVEIRNLDSGSDPNTERTVLHENQQIVYRTGSTKHEVQAVVARNAIQWPQGMLEIDDESLIDVVNELARYTDRHIVIARDPALAPLRVVGTLNIRDVRLALARLQQIAPVAIAETTGAFTLTYRSAPALATSQTPNGPR